jgi:hypothetical protein
MLLGDIGALFSTLQTLMNIIIFKFLNVEVLFENSLLSRVFRRRDIRGENQFKSERVNFSYLRWLFIDNSCR